MPTPPSTAVGVHEAASRFTELVEQVAQGHSFILMDEGRPVAQMIPIRIEADRERRSNAIQHMRSLAQRNQLNGLSIRDLREEGRR